MKNAGPAAYSLLLWEVTPRLGSVARCLPVSLSPAVPHLRRHCLPEANEASSGTLSLSDPSVITCAVTPRAAIDCYEQSRPFWGKARRVKACSGPPNLRSVPSPELKYD
jgi:hypothetical protein